MVQDIDLGHCIFLSKKSGNEMFCTLRSKIIFNTVLFILFNDILMPLLIDEFEACWEAN